MPLIDRDEEIAMLMRRWERAWLRDGQLVMISERARPGPRPRGISALAIDGADGLAELLRETQAVMRAVEGLRWADPTTLDVMKSLAERGALEPLFIVATTRPEFRPPWAVRSPECRKSSRQHLSCAPSLRPDAAGFVEFLVEGAVGFAVAFRLDYGRFPRCDERFNHALVGIESLVGQQHVGFHQRLPRVGTFQIVRLARREEEGERIAQRIDQAMDFGA
jgi:hypothetical protein